MQVFQIRRYSAGIVLSRASGLLYFSCGRNTSYIGCLVSNINVMGSWLSSGHSKRMCIVPALHCLASTVPIAYSV